MPLRLGLPLLLPLHLLLLLLLGGLQGGSGEAAVQQTVRDGTLPLLQQRQQGQLLPLLLVNSCRVR